MPKTTWIHPHRPPLNVPPPDMLRDLFNRYQRAQGLDSEALGKLLGISSGAVRCKKHGGTQRWALRDVQQWCEVLNITDPTELGKAILHK